VNCEIVNVRAVPASEMVSELGVTAAMVGGAGVGGGVGFFLPRAKAGPDMPMTSTIAMA